MSVISQPLRCPWTDVGKPDYVAYHDTEWGVPVHDDRKLFEFLVLESAQAGLSWYTILRKREHYRQAFAEFDPTVVADFGEEQVQALLNNAGIVRNRLKILATLNNAQRFLEVQAAFGSFDRYLWDFVDGQPIINHWETLSECPTSTPVSNALSQDLKRRGFAFLGATVCYAYMQAIGMVNDHLVSCFRHQELAVSPNSGTGETIMPSSSAYK